MNPKQFRAFLDLLMCSDPWPVDDGGESQKALDKFANEEAVRHGQRDWVGAYHHLGKEEKATNDPELQKHKEKIDGMGREEMARLWRFAPSGHPYFKTGPVYDYFNERFTSLGGMSPEISKKIGL